MFLIINVATEFCALRQLHHEQNIETLTLRKTQKEDELVAKDGGEYCRVGRSDSQARVTGILSSSGGKTNPILALMVKIFFIIQSVSSCVKAWLYFSVFAFCWSWVIG